MAYWVASVWADVRIKTIKKSWHKLLGDDEVIGENVVDDCHQNNIHLVQHIPG